ncbi:MAG: hypothetical protein GMKNLPBB_00409 [Myxococcota bacterium]|nr:hypothetical protein [Myxococcota bacterium]
MRRIPSSGVAFLGVLLVFSGLTACGGTELEGPGGQNPADGGAQSATDSGAVGGNDAAIPSLDGGVTENDGGGDPGQLDASVPGGGPAEYPRLPPMDGVKRWIVLGDSISDGCCRTFAQSYVGLLKNNNDREWPGFKGKDLTTKYPGIEYLDYAEGGATTKTLLSKQMPKVQGGKPGKTVVTVTIGGNNLLAILGSSKADGARAADAYAADLKTMLDFFADKKNFPDGAFVYMANIYEFTDNTGDVKLCPRLPINWPDAIFIFERYRKELTGLAKTYDNVAVVPLWEHFLGHGYLSGDQSRNKYYDPADPTNWFESDCIHPTPRGHHEIRRLFWSHITGEPMQIKVP